MWVCLAFPPYLAWIEQPRSFSTEGKKKKKTEHRRRRSGVAKEAEPPQSWSASNICCSHFSDMCTYCGQHGGPAATWPDDISFFLSWQPSAFSLSLASASSSASSHSSKTCQRGELLTRSVGVALSVVGWPAQDVPRLLPGCHLGQAPASHDP